MADKSSCSSSDAINLFTQPPPPRCSSNTHHRRPLFGPYLRTTQYIRTPKGLSVLKHTRSAGHRNPWWKYIVFVLFRRKHLALYAFHRQTLWFFSASPTSEQSQHTSLLETWWSTTKKLFVLLSRLFISPQKSRARRKASANYLLLLMSSAQQHLKPRTDSCAAVLYSLMFAMIVDEWIVSNMMNILSFAVH